MGNLCGLWTLSLRKNMSDSVGPHSVHVNFNVPHEAFKERWHQPRMSSSNLEIGRESGGSKPEHPRVGSFCSIFWARRGSEKNLWLLWESYYDEKMNCVCVWLVWCLMNTHCRFVHWCDQHRFKVRLILARGSPHGTPKPLDWRSWQSSQKV